jgi:hypothetical protein
MKKITIISLVALVVLGYAFAVSCVSSTPEKSEEALGVNSESKDTLMENIYISTDRLEVVNEKILSASAEVTKLESMCKHYMFRFREVEESKEILISIIKNNVSEVLDREWKVEIFSRLYKQVQSSNDMDIPDFEGKIRFEKYLIECMTSLDYGTDQQFFIRSVLDVYEEVYNYLLTQ